MNRINKKMGKNKNKRLCLGIFAIIMLLFVPVSAYASEIKKCAKAHSFSLFVLYCKNNDDCESAL